MTLRAQKSKKKRRRKLFKSLTCFLGNLMTAEAISKWLMGLRTQIQKKSKNVFLKIFRSLAQFLNN